MIVGPCHFLFIYTPTYQSGTGHETGHLLSWPLILVISLRSSRNIPG